jgi:hypothetical protein
MTRSFVTIAAVFFALGCSSSKDTGSGSVAGASNADAQTPPTGESALAGWLGQKMYNTWKCEQAPHDARAPSPHGTNRICSNDLLSKSVGGEFPVGAAAVKELYDGGNIVGYAVYRKVAKGGGDSWYWFEKVSGDLKADGVGSSGPPKDVCVGCHSHAPNDFVFTQVR